MPKLDLKLKFRLETGPKLPKRVNVFSFLHFCKFPLGPPLQIFIEIDLKRALQAHAHVFEKSIFFRNFRKIGFLPQKEDFLPLEKPALFI